MLPWKNPPAEGIFTAVAQVSANGTKIGGVAGRVKALSWVGAAFAVSTTAR